MKENVHQTTQVIAGVVAADNAQQAQQLTEALQQQNIAFTQAVEQISKVRDFVGSPEHILGNARTKHGEIAQEVEVGIRNARSYLQHQSPTATFDGVGRTAPEDYLIDGLQVQSKFINGASKNLDHVLDHMAKYEYFGRDSSYYQIPKDYYESIQKILDGQSVEGLSARAVQKIQEKAQEIERLSGKPFSEVVKPGLSEYGEVQQGKIHETLDGHEQQLRSENQKLKDNLQTEAQPNLGDLAQVAAQGALIGGSLRLAFKLYEKWSQGKNPFQGDFTLDDWRELGVDTAQGAAMGGVSAGAIYALTNFANLSAPFAGGLVSAGLAITSLAQNCANGQISIDEFIQLGQIACAESAIVALTSAIGQTLIPIPVLGTVIGTIAGRMVVDFGKKYLGGQAEDLQRKLDQFYSQYLAKIDQTYQEAVAQIIAEYERLGDLTKAAFDRERNIELRLQASVQLAQAYQVLDKDIIRNTTELDAFMLA